MKPARKTSEPGAAETRKPLYYGWIVVAVCFFIVVISAGARTSFGAFFNPMREDFGWSYGLTSLALSIGMLVGGFFGPFVGYLLDKLGGRTVILWGTVITGARAFYKTYPKARLHRRGKSRSKKGRILLANLPCRPEQRLPY